MQRLYCRYRKYEIEAAVEQAVKEGFQVIVPIQKAKKYHEDCLEGRVERYVKFPRVNNYGGYIAAVEKEDKNEH